MPSLHSLDVGADASHQQLNLSVCQINVHFAPMPLGTEKSEWRKIPERPSKLRRRRWLR